MGETRSLRSLKHCLTFLLPSSLFYSFLPPAPSDFSPSADCLEITILTLSCLPTVQYPITPRHKALEPTHTTDLWNFDLKYSSLPLWHSLTYFNTATTIDWNCVSPVSSPIAFYSGGTLGVLELSKGMHSTVLCDIIYWRNQWIPGEPLLGKVKMSRPSNISGSSAAQFYWDIRCNSRGAQMEKLAFLGWWNMLGSDRQHQPPNSLRSRELDLMSLPYHSLGSAWPLPILHLLEWFILVPAAQSKPERPLVFLIC